MLVAFTVTALVGALTGFVLGAIATRDRGRHLHYLLFGAIGTSFLAALPMVLGGAQEPITSLIPLLVFAVFSVGLAVLFTSPKRRR